MFVRFRRASRSRADQQSERTQRSPRSSRNTKPRKGSRTTKGANRRSTIVTVFASLQTRITNFTLANMLAEIDRWTTAGVSLFESELAAMKANLPPPKQHPQIQQPDSLTPRPKYTEKPQLLCKMDSYFKCTVED